MAEISNKSTAKKREKLTPYVEDLVWRLFEDRGQPIYDRGKISSEKIEAFVCNDEAFNATCQFQLAIAKAWEQLYPDIPLKRIERKNDMEPQTTQPLDSIDPDSKKISEFVSTPKDQAPENSVIKSEHRLPPIMEEPDESDADNDTSHKPQDISNKKNPEPERQPDPNAIQPGQVPSSASPPTKSPALRATFHLPNARVGVEYVAVIDGRAADDRPLEILDVKVPADLGLSFHREHGELRGTPQVDGDYRLPLRWTPEGDSASYSGECLLIVNPDPKSLWKIIEPPTDAPYPKPHLDGRRIAGDGVQVFAASRRGRSHEHAGTFRDDDFFIHADTDGGWSTLIVADGAGSAKFSREGARLAVKAAGDVLTLALAGETGERLATALSDWDSDPTTTAQSMNADLHYLFHQAGTDAVQAIEQAANEQSSSFRDYSTTLLAAVAKSHNGALFLSSFWMGDGAIAAYGPRGKVRLMGAPDSGEFAGQTRFLDRTALSEQGFAKRIGIGHFRDLTAVVLMTDGVSDPYFETDKGLMDGTRWDRLWDELEPLLREPAPDQALVQWLDFFSQGNHDDRTIALVRPDANAPGETA
ncbi:PP2C family serine/threonine-protein phosphatase [Thiorhodovibrio frisius]|uniref:PPM-type phosphatase domain-containing protein n=1 Tax=Thiorhodovibrio frisius TaxID=631362 RepID=H8YX68_9GAMM|nr:PP2C family serine/threonine-protein phosphatase [Thiorhodovibrio frisius]EIC23044.1 hypothetical protein Thi970DRAFT_00695 [Thiorhodovibrio frisius]WPL22691.1 hypothetical protein Thiofri_02861 [Thiorhodovibrio frisius]